MVEKLSKDIRAYMDDCLMAAPMMYTVADKENKERLLMIWPMSLGKKILVERVMDELNLSWGHESQSQLAKCLYSVRRNRMDVARILALCNCRTKEDHFDKRRIDGDCRYIAENLEDSELASLLVYILTSDRYDEILKSCHIDIDVENKRRVSEIKGADNSTVSFGGNTVFGSLISFFLDKGMTIDQIVWQESYINLMLVMADAPCTVYLSKDEKKRVRLRAKPSERIMADDPRNARLVADIINGGQ